MLIGNFGEHTSFPRNCSNGAQLFYHVKKQFFFLSNKRMLM